MKVSLSLAALAAIACGTGSEAAPPRTTPVQVRETVHPVAREKLPGGTQELIAVEVVLPPGAAALPHRHPAFVYAYVLSGIVVSALNDETPRTYRAGQSWHEEPDALHRVTRNPSRTRPARLLAVFITRAGETELVRPVSGN